MARLPYADLTLENAALAARIARERVVLAYTDAMTREVQVPDAVFAAVRALFDPRGVVELTATIAAYNMVSRFLQALRIHAHDELA